MEEVAGVLEEKQYDYQYLRGQTGPLVYPAGFVYIYSLLYWVTDHGENIRLAQVIFAGLYLIFIATIFYIYYRCDVSSFRMNEFLKQRNLGTRMDVVVGVFIKKNSFDICVTII